MCLAIAASSILLVVLDDVSRVDYEAVRLPAMHGLQAEGVYFPNAYAMPICSPSRAALQFGEYAYHHGIGTALAINAPLSPLPEDVLTLAEVLRGGGFRTLHTGKWHLSSKVAQPTYQQAPNQHGYDHALAWSHGNLEVDKWQGVPGTGYDQWVRYDDGQGSLETAYATTAVIDAALAWWVRTPGRKFASVNLHAPHYPLHVPPAHLLPPGYPTPTTDREKWEAMLVAADSEIGRLLGAIDLSDTYVVLFSDNGTPGQVYTGPGGGKGTMYEGGVDVPLVLAGPGVEPGTSRRLVHLVDVMATVCQLAGLPYRADGDGLSFADAALPRIPANPVREWVFLDRFAPNSLDLTFPALNLRERSVRRADGYKLVLRETPSWTQELLWLLPDETTDLPDPDVRAELRAILEGA